MSRASQRSSKFKKSNVDETLGGKSNKENASQSGNKGSVGIISLSELTALRSKIEKGGQDPKCSVITRDDLGRMRAQTAIKTRRDLENERKAAQTAKESTRAAANARKQRMMEHDKMRASKMPENELDAMARTKAEGLLTKAQMQQDEQKDDVKVMNQMMLYSQVVTIRDKQVEENKRLEAEWVEEQKRLDLMMEIERLKALRAVDKREQERQIALKQGASMIVDQIREREAIRAREEEVREKEKNILLMNIEKMKREDQEAVLAKQRMVENTIKEVAAANAQAIEMKEVAKKREKDLELEIIEYNRKRDEAENAKNAEAARLREEKERETQKLRDMQERANDRQAEIDALRAKRAYEEGERKAREARAASAKKRAAQIKDMEESRMKQFREKDLLFAQQAKAERSEFLVMNEKQKAAQEVERRLEEEKREALRNHSKMIRMQISKNEELKKQERLNYLEEGKKARQAVEDERQKIMQIKQNKLDNLAKLNIPSKYMGELKNKKVTF